MSNAKLSIAFTDLKTRGTMITRPKSTFLCYADATLVIAAGDQEIVSIRFRNMQLKEVNGTFRFDFHSEKANGKWYPTVFPKTAISRKRLTLAIKRAYQAHLARTAAAA